MRAIEAILSDKDFSNLSGDQLQSYTELWMKYIKEIKDYGTVLEHLLAECAPRVNNRFSFAIIYASRLEAYDRNYAKALQVLLKMLDTELEEKNRAKLLQSCYAFSGRILQRFERDQEKLSMDAFREEFGTNYKAFSGELA